MPPKTSPKAFIEADCAFAAIAARSILAAGVLVEDAVIDALDRMKESDYVSESGKTFNCLLTNCRYLILNT